MNFRVIRIVYGKELRDSLRDRRAIISMIVVPMLAIPLLMTGIGALMLKIVTQARQEIPRVMVIGGENSPKVLSALRAARNLEIVPATEDFTNQIVEKRIRAVVNARRLPPCVLPGLSVKPRSMLVTTTATYSGLSSREAPRGNGRIRRRFSLC